MHGVLTSGRERLSRSRLGFHSGGAAGTPSGHCTCGSWVACCRGYWVLHPLALPPRESCFGGPPLVCDTLVPPHAHSCVGKCGCMPQAGRLLAQDPTRLEDLTGLTELHRSAAALAADFDDDQPSDDEDALV